MDPVTPPARHGLIAHDMLCSIDVKDTFRQIYVDPLHLLNLGTFRRVHRRGLVRAI